MSGGVLTSCATTRAIAEFPVSLEAAEAGVAAGMMTAMGAPNAMRGKSYSGNLSAREAHAAGIRVIHQEPEIVPDLTVAERGSLPPLGMFTFLRMSRN